MNTTANMAGRTAGRAARASMARAVSYLPYALHLLPLPHGSGQRAVAAAGDEIGF